MKKIVKGIVIGGPTGIGKTDLALTLAHRLNGELISCDSVQVFRDLTIGANKTPTDPIPQHCLDLVHWSQPYTVADFWRDCHRVVLEVAEKGKVPILVGGSGFWLDWVLKGRPGAPPSDPSIMAKIDADIKADNDWNLSFRRLEIVDPEYAKILNENDYYRLKRALVVHRMTGLPLSSFKERQGNTEEISIDWRCFYLTYRDRWALLKHIDRRCELMVKKGLVEEVLQLMKNGFHPDCQAGRAIGYQETLKYIKSVKQCIENNENVQKLDEITIEYLKDFQAQTRQYTRRQEKWFYKMDMFRWIERSSLSDDLSHELVDKVVGMYEADKDLYDDIQWKENIDCQSLKEANWTPDIGLKRRKELKLYSSCLNLFSTPDDRLRLSSIIKDFHL